MASTLGALDGVVDWLLRTSLYAAVLAVLILTMNAILRRALPARARYALLLLVAARLLMPFAPQSRFSALNLMSRSPTALKTTTISDAPPTGEWIITKQPLLQPLDPDPVPRAIKPATPWPFTWKTVAAAIWIAGILLMVLRLVAANIKLSRRLRSAKLLTDSKAIELLRSCKAQMRIHRSLPVLETDVIHSPALMGFIRPRLLLPLNLRRQLSNDELRFVFLHELAHLKRGDIAVDWCLAMLQTFHWFNPLIALAFARARAERELARDAMVLAAATPNEQTGYGQTILKLVECFSRLGPRPGTIGLLEGNSGKTQLKRRITMIANFQRPMPGATILAVLIAVTFAFALFTDRKVTAAPEAAAADKSHGQKSDAGDPRPAPVTGAADVSRKDEQAARDAAIQAILDHRMPELKFNAVALGDALEFLRDTTEANMSVNWKALAASGIEKTTPITIRMRNVKVATALKAILEDAGGNNVKLAFEINDGVLFISTAEEIEKNTEVQVYDVRDLLTLKDDKVDEGQLKQLTEVLEQNIDPNSWAESGGSIGTIKHLNGQLVITQNKANHKRVASLLDKLRQVSALQISVNSHLIKASPAILKELGIELRKDGLLINVKPTGKALKPVQGQILDDEQANTLLKAVQATPDSTILHAPRVTAFNGQRATIAIGGEVPYISGWTAVKDGKRDPQISYAKTGFIFNLQGFISADRKFVTMNMQPRIVTLRKMDQVPWPQAPADEKSNIQKPDLAVLEIDEMVSIPDGGTLLTVLPEKEQKANDSKGMVNILLVRPSIIVQPQAEQPQVPVEKRPE